MMPSLVTLPVTVVDAVHTHLASPDSRSLSSVCRKMRIWRGHGWRVLEFTNYLIHALLEKLKSLQALFADDVGLALSVRAIYVRHLNLSQYIGVFDVSAAEKKPYNRLDGALAPVLRLTPKLETFLLDGPPGICSNQCYPNTLDAICTLSGLRVLVLGRVHGAKERSHIPEYVPKLASSKLEIVNVCFPIQLNCGAFVAGQRNLRRVAVELDGSEPKALANTWTDVSELWMDRLWVLAEANECWDHWVDITKNAVAAGALHKLERLALNGPATYAQLDKLVSLLSGVGAPLKSLYFLASDENMEVWPEFGPHTLEKIFRSFPELKALCLDQEGMEFPPWPGSMDGYVEAFKYARTLATFVVPAASLPVLRVCSKRRNDDTYRDVAMQLGRQIISQCPTLEIICLAASGNMVPFNMTARERGADFYTSQEFFDHRFFWIPEENLDIGRATRHGSTCGMTPIR